MDKTLFENRFLAVIERDGYTFSREVRANGHLVSLLPFRDTDQGREYLERIEICPAHSMEPDHYSITGGLENDETPLACAATELYEEAGYRVEQTELIDLGTVRPSKSADTVVHLFAVDVTGKVQHDAPGDGTRWEQNAGVRWVDLAEAITNRDPLFFAAILRLQQRALSSL